MNRTRTTLLTAALALLASTSTSCLLIPEIQDRVVELVISGSATTEWTSSGTLNNHDDQTTIDIRDFVDIRQSLEDAGVDIENVQRIAVAGMSYRTTLPDPTAGRQIVNGQVSFQRSGGSEVPLVIDFTEDVNSVTTFKTATLSAGGVTQVNALLADLLAELQGGPPANTVFTYHVTGQSVPGDVGTNFTWELKLDLNMVGTISVEVPN